ncbi:MspA family porin [Mycobacteroides salmoniphilum]|nr:MspA family porin [Mycobacteroides salmoniphilum]
MRRVFQVENFGKATMNPLKSSTRRRGPARAVIRAVSGLFAVLAMLATSAVTANAQGLSDSNLLDRTEDGWGIEVSTLDEEVNPVPNLAATAFSREAFVQFTGVGKINGQGSNPVTSASVTIGYQMGCQIDLSQGITLGGSVGAGVGGGVGGIFGGPGPFGAGFGAVGAGAGINGGLQFTLRPGGIVAIPMDSMALRGSEARLRVRNMHIKIDACGGPVTVRSFTLLSITTDFTHSSLATYGDPVQI